MVVVGLLIGLLIVAVGYAIVIYKLLKGHPTMLIPSARLRKSLLPPFLFENEFSNDTVMPGPLRGQRASGSYSGGPHVEALTSEGTFHLCLVEGAD